MFRRMPSLAVPGNRQLSIYGRCLAGPVLIGCWGLKGVPAAGWNCEVLQ